MPYYLPEGDSAKRIVDRLAVNGWRGQIVGPHGTGKSTLLRVLVDELIRRGRRPRLVAFHDGGTRMLTVAEDSRDCTDLVLDGFEQINWLGRFRLCRRMRRTGCGLLTTSHRSLGLPTLLHTRVDTRTAMQVVAFLSREEATMPFDASEIDWRLRRRDGICARSCFSPTPGNLHAERTPSPSRRKIRLR